MDSAAACTQRRLKAETLVPSAMTERRGTPATRWGKAGSLSLMPPSSTSSNPRDLRSLYAIHLTSTPFLPKNSCCRFVLPDPSEVQTSIATSAAAATTPHVRRPLDFLCRGRAWRTVPRRRDLKRRCWMQGSCLGSGQKGRRGEHPARRSTLSVCRLAS